MTIVHDGLHAIIVFASSGCIWSYWLLKPVSLDLIQLGREVNELSLFCWSTQR